MPWTTAEALAEVRRRARLPSSDPTYTDAALLAEMDSVINAYMAPAMSSIRENYWVKEVDVSLAADTSEYGLPARAFGESIIDVLYKDTDGDHFKIDQYNIDERHTFNNAGSSTDRPLGVVIMANKLQVIPTPTSATGSIKVLYQNRRGKLATTTDTFKITNIGGNVISGNVPSSWTNSDSFDFIQDLPGFDTIATDLTAAAVVSGATLTMNAAPPSDLAIGDWVGLSWATPVIQLPMELHDALYWFTAAAVLGPLGDLQTANTFRGWAENSLSRVASALTPRIKTKNRKIRNESSLLRGRRSSYTTRRWY